MQQDAGQKASRPVCRPAEEQPHPQRVRFGLQTAVQRSKQHACPRMAAFRPSGRNSRSAAPRKASSSATGSTRQLRRRPAAPAGAAADDGNSSSDPAASAAQSSAARPNVFQNAAVPVFLSRTALPSADIVPHPPPFAQAAELFCENAKKFLLKQLTFSLCIWYNSHDFSDELVVLRPRPSEVLYL